MDEKHGTRKKSHSNSREKVQVKVDQFVQYVCSLAIVQQILYMYNGIKHSNKTVEKTLGNVEEGFRVAYGRSLDLYDRYQQMNLNNQPKHILETVFMFGIGIIVILMQLNLTLLVAVITMFFNIIIGGKEAIEYASKSTTNAQAKARQVVTDLSEKVQEISRISTEKAEEQANRILDKANRVAHLTMGVSDESDDIEKTPFNRLQDLTHRILENSWNRVEGQFDAKSIVECLRNSISLADMVRKNKSWVLNKVGKLRTSMDELKISLEKEGERLKTNPEEILMRFLQQTSSILPERLRMLEEASEKMLSENAASKLAILISYIEKLNEKLVEADDVHELKDEVLKEAHDRLVDLLQWLADHKSCNENTQAKNFEWNSEKSY